MTEWNEEDHYPDVPGGCHCSVPALCAGSPFKARCRELKATNAALVEALGVAFSLSCERAESRRKWTQRDQAAHDTISAALELAKGG